MPHPLIALYDAQISNFASAAEGTMLGMIRLKKKGVLDSDPTMKQTQCSHNSACMKRDKLRAERDALVRDLESLDRLREMSMFFISWRDSLESDAKNPRLPDAQRHFSAATAARINVLLLGGRVAQ